MKKIALLLFASALIFSCMSTQNVSENQSTSSTDKSYGFTQKNPIKVGGGQNGPINERNFLNALTGPNGEKVTYTRSGSCCSFPTKNSPLGEGLLDVYTVTYEGQTEAATLYLNMYDKAPVKAPVGFKMK